MATKVWRSPEAMKGVGVTFEPDTLEELNELSVAIGCGRSELIRNAVKAYIPRLKDDLVLSDSVGK